MSRVFRTFFEHWSGCGASAPPRGSRKFLRRRSCCFHSLPSDDSCPSNGAQTTAGILSRNFPTTDCRNINCSHYRRFVGSHKNRIRVLGDYERLVAVNSFCNDGEFWFVLPPIEILTPIGKFCACGRRTCLPGRCSLCSRWPAHSKASRVIRSRTKTDWGGGRSNRATEARTA